MKRVSSLFHNAAAPSYQELLEYYRPKILPGLMATPERADGRISRGAKEFWVNRHELDLYDFAPANIPLVEKLKGAKN